MTKPKVQDEAPASSFVIRHFALALFLCAFASPAFAVEPLEEFVEQRFEVDADVTVSIQNIDGSVRVYGAEEPVVTVQAIKKAYNAERLRGILVDTKATPKSVAITTSFPPRKGPLSDRSGTVDYIIVVPQTAKIAQIELVNGEVLLEGLRNGGGGKAHLVNGGIAGHNCFGDLDLAVETGRLDIAYDWWETREFAIKAFNTRGNIRAFLPSDVSLNLSAVAPEGRIANGFTSTKPTPAEVVHSIAEVIGAEAQTVVSLEARRGNIRIERVNY
jgi:hypothetical protein